MTRLLHCARTTLLWLATAAVLHQAASAAARQTPPDAPATRPDAPPASQPDGEAAAPAYVLIKTTKGEFVIELDRAHAPISSDNFLTYVEDGFYDGTIFHRVIAGFMIQGGGFTPELTKKETREPIANEWQNGLKNKRGTVAMARLGGQADSATSQFFVNVTDNAALDRPADGAAYAVFGRVVAGMTVVDEIRFVPVQPQGSHEALPREPVVIEKASVIAEDEAKKRIEDDRPKRRVPREP